MPQPSKALKAPRTEATRLVTRVVVPVEGTDREFLAQQWAVEFAAALEAPLYAVHVALGPEGRSPDLFQYLRGECKKWEVELEAQVLEGSDVADELCNELGPQDLVIVGSRRLPKKNFHVGSIARALVEKAPCPVQIVRLA